MAKDWRNFVAGTRRLIRHLTMADIQPMPPYDSCLHAESKSDHAGGHHVHLLSLMPRLGLMRVCAQEEERQKKKNETETKRIFIAS